MAHIVQAVIGCTYIFNAEERIQHIRLCDEVTHVNSSNITKPHSISMCTSLELSLLLPFTKLIKHNLSCQSMADLVIQFECIFSRIVSCYALLSVYQLR